MLFMMVSLSLKKLILEDPFENMGANLLKKQLRKLMMLPETELPLPQF